MDKTISYLSELTQHAVVFYFTCFLIIGAAHLVKFYFNTEKRQYLFFGLFSLLFALKSIIAGQIIFNSFIPEYISEKIEFAIFYFSVPVFLNYLFFCFPDKFNKKILIISYSICLGFLAFSIVMSFKYTEYTTLLYGFVVLAAGIYSAIAITRAIKDKYKTAIPIFTGTVIIILCSINDLLFIYGYIVSFRLVTASVLLFSFMQAWFLLTASDKPLTGSDTSLYEEKTTKDYFSSVSHELRTPLNGIIGLAESMLQGSLGPLSSDQLGTLSLIVSSGVRLSNLLNDMIDYSKIKEGDLAYKKTTVDIYQAATMAISAEAQMIIGTPISLKNNIDRESIYAYGNEGLIKHAIYNLISTIIKFAEKGEISISAKELDNTVEITIENSNADNIRDKVKSIFNAFETGDLTLIKGYEGTGLGLEISKKIIEYHDGKIDIKADTDDKASFVFTLQKGDKSKFTEKTFSGEEMLHMDELQENMKSVLNEVTSPRDVHILIVDDDIVSLQIMKSQLASMNYNVIPVLNGEDALKKIEQKPPDLVLLDVLMPGMNGYEVCRRIREKYSSVELPVILITVKNQISDMMEGLTSGANDFLTKPYQQEEFLTRINTHIQLARMTSMYSRFVPTEFLRCLGQENIVELKLGDQVQREMTILFVDIRAFTSLSEEMSPKENFKFINSYLSRFSPMIGTHNGFVDKYVGDAIMALYPGGPEDAIKTAIEMVEHIKIYNGHRNKCGYKPINIGVGIHTGNLILGIIGDDVRMQGTVISDAVNLASRIQDVTKLYKANIVISQETFIKLQNPMDYDFRFLGKVKVKGKAKTVSLFEIYNTDSEEIKQAKTDTKRDFETGILLFSKKEFFDARKLFEKIVAVNPSDYTAQLFLDRTKKYMAMEKRKFLTSV